MFLICSCFASNLAVFNLFADTYEEAKLFAGRKRITRPVKYSGIKNKKPTKDLLNAGQRKVYDLQAQLKNKIERLTSLKSSLRFLNKKSDKKMIEHIDSSDIDEYDDLFCDDDAEPSEMAIVLFSENVMTNNLFSEPNENAAVGCSSDDLIEIDASPINIGVDPMQIDRAFSLEYSYSIDVIQIE